ncbi:MAG: hypothetical protein JOS17DRAFT_545026 [Linnemannia elongata]|nr:MAG: hypothetical protein JOS17DRAFT_545026 [Linnemannia elongata]
MFSFLCILPLLCFLHPCCSSPFLSSYHPTYTSSHLSYSHATNPYRISFRWLPPQLHTSNLLIPLPLLITTTTTTTLPLLPLLLHLLLLLLLLISHLFPLTPPDNLISPIAMHSSPITLTPLTVSPLLFLPSQPSSTKSILQPTLAMPSQPSGRNLPHCKSHTSRHGTQLHPSTHFRPLMEYFSRWTRNPKSSMRACT